MKMVSEKCLIYNMYMWVYFRCARETIGAISNAQKKEELAIPFEAFGALYDQYCFGGKKPAHSCLVHRGSIF